MFLLAPSREQNSFPQIFPITIVQSKNSDTHINCLEWLVYLNWILITKWLSWRGYTFLKHDKYFLLMKVMVAPVAYPITTVIHRQKEIAYQLNIQIIWSSLGQVNSMRSINAQVFLAKWSNIIELIWSLRTKELNPLLCFPNRKRLLKIVFVKHINFVVILRSKLTHTFVNGKGCWYIHYIVA